MSEQQQEKMKYPKGRMCVVRDCTVDICLKNNPGAVLLSVLLFWYDNPHKGDYRWQEEEEHMFTVCRTQTDIELASCHQIDVKTIHDTAVPLLCLLGYLTVTEKMNGNLYTLHMDHVLAAYTAYGNGPDCLKAFLKASLQLESAPIRIPHDELESVLINKSRLYLQLARTLIAIRENSNCKRGRKPGSQVPGKLQFRKPQTIETIETNTREDYGVSAIAPTQPSLLSGKKPVNNDEAPTEKLPVVRPPTPELPKQPVAFRPPKRPKPPKPPESEEQKQSEAARKRAVTLRIQEIRTLYNTLMGREVTWSRDNQDGAKQLAESKDATDEAIKLTVKAILKDRFWGPQITLKVVAKQIDARVVSHKPTPSNGHMSALQPSDEPDYNALLFGRQKWDQAAGKYLPVVN